MGGFLLACNFAAAGVPGETQVAASTPPAAPAQTQVPENSGNQQNASAENVQSTEPVKEVGTATQVKQESTATPMSGELYVPLSGAASVPPPDVLQQITWVGAGGGDKPNCDLMDGTHCVNASQDTIYLTDFEPNRQVRIELYSPTNIENDGFHISEFLAEITGQTDANGALEIRVDRDLTDFKFVVLDENGNIMASTTGVIAYRW